MSNALAIEGGKPVRGTLLGYGHQDIVQADVDSVVKTLLSENLTCGPATARFEQALSRATQAQHVTAVSNGTAALHVACLATGIAPGDEVIVSPITFAASANCVLYCGATPVFADIDSRTWNISPQAIAERINPRTKAIVAVDFGGVPVDLEPIREIAHSNGLTLIEDAAHSLGSKYHDRPIGSIADLTTFSFHPVKTVTTGEGGAIATNDEELDRKVRLFSKHGITRDVQLMEYEPEGGWYYEQLELGYNYRMSDIQAALGVSQLERLRAFADRRREIVQLYNDAFSGIPELRFQYDPHPNDTIRHLYCIRLDVDALHTTKKYVYDALRAEGIGVNVHYLPVYRLPYYRRMGYSPDCCPEANRYYDEAITLPLFYGMSDQDIQDVVEAVEKVVFQLRKA